MVVNFELPNDAESYVHRIGRTGRAGAEGKAFSLVSDRDVEALQRIESYLKHKLNIGWMEDTELVKEFTQFPSEQEFIGAPDATNGAPRPHHRPQRQQRDNRDQRGGRDSRGRRDQRDARGPRDQRDQRENRRDAKPGQQQGRHPHKQGEKRHSQHNKTQGGRPQHKHSKHPHKQNRPHRGSSSVVAQKSLAQKVSGFFKRLFGA